MKKSKKIIGRIFKPLKIRLVAFFLRFIGIITPIATLLYLIYNPKVSVFMPIILNAVLIYSISYIIDLILNIPYKSLYLNEKEIDFLNKKISDEDKLKIFNKKSLKSGYITYKYLMSKYNEI